MGLKAQLINKPEKLKLFILPNVAKSTDTTYINYKTIFTSNDTVEVTGMVGLNNVLTIDTLYLILRDSSNQIIANISIPKGKIDSHIVATKASSKFIKYPFGDHKYSSIFKLESYYLDTNQIFSDTAFFVKQ